MLRSAASVRTGLRVADAISPALAGGIAYRLFFRTRPRMPLRDRERATDLAARREVLRTGRRAVVSYRWGEGPRTVLLIHGWKGRAIQFAPLVRELVAEGMRVVSFDAPAHGSSPGRSTDIRDWMAAIERMQDRFGPFAAIVGHSVGAVAGLAAARTFAAVPVVVTISGTAGPMAMVDEFARMTDLSAGARIRLAQLFAARIGESPASVAERFDSAAHPLPAETSLLVVHGRDDRGLSDADSVRLHRAHGARSRMLRPSNLGHNRILADDEVLDAVVSVVTRGGHAETSAEPAARGGGERTNRRAKDARTVLPIA
ncbi:alpha/beta hydrolase [Microbacterium sp. M28]|uniref:alpha/beta hydrolase family protein n=1 Tax=Microbacterium sp. M28 TaxID=2962064 RepID=UPI0021F478D2|nr:alpha/beta hydrolase [Microbacterium sp. M28]UYO97252.1 alpha/beta hydrolase [Microbacterium sp. M28]